MFLQLIFSITASYFLVITNAQSSLVPSMCVGTISTFPNCDSANTIIARCNELTEQPDLINCMCNQQFIDSWVGCESEFRQCALSTSFDSDFDSLLVEWHKKCDKHLSASITTPPLVEPTATLEQGVCESIIESCDRYIKSKASCTSSLTGGPELTSCRCEKTLLSQASVCKIDQENCLGSKADITNLWEYKNCPGASTIFSQGPVITGSATQNSTRSTITSPPVTGPWVTPIFKPQTTTQSTSTQSGAGLGKRSSSMCFLGFLSIVAVSFIYVV